MLPDSCRDLGKSLEASRIYLAGRISIEHGDDVIDERALAGRQARVAFAFLVAERYRPIDKATLVSVIWPHEPPREVEVSLNAILSKLRAILKRAHLGGAAIDVLSGAVQLRLAAEVWVDLEHAANAIDDAEGAWRGGDAARAWGNAVAVVVIARRPFLAGEDAHWIQVRREKMRALRDYRLVITSPQSPSAGVRAGIRCRAS